MIGSISLIELRWLEWTGIHLNEFLIILAMKWM